MLSEYYEDNHIACEILYRQLKSLNISHAYIIETNNYYRGYDFALSFAKAILCPTKNVDYNLCGNCDLCTQIDNGNSTELEIVRPDGMWIKKDQLNGLQKDFSTKAVTSSAKVYIIDQAEKMNEAASNSILKFLEEPEENIIAFLLTNNVNRMLKTIVSRCQIITLNNENNYFSNNTIENYTNLFNNLDFSTDDKKNEIEQVVNFIKYLEKEKLFTITKEKSLWLDYFKDRDTFIRGLILSLYFYRDCLRTKNINDHNLFFYDYLDILNEISSKNDYDSLYKKVSLLIEYNNWIKGNMNTNLLLDLFIIEFGGDL